MASVGDRIYELIRSRDVRYWIAKNPNTPHEVLNLLARDSDLHISVARNPSTPQEALTFLTNVGNDRPIEDIARNPIRRRVFLTLLQIPRTGVS